MVDTTQITQKSRTGATTGVTDAVHEVIGRPTIQELHTLQQLAYADPGIGPVQIVSAQIKSGAHEAGKKLWLGMTAVAATGFGKGVLIAAAAIVVMAAIAGGITALSGVPMVPSLTGMLVPASLEKGLAMGIERGLNAVFFNPLAWVGLGIGGALGAASDVRKKQNEINAEIAQAQALEYEARRQMPQPAKDMQPALAPAAQQPQVLHVSYNPAATTVTHIQPEASFAEREMARRTDTQATQAVAK